MGRAAERSRGCRSELGVAVIVTHAVSDGKIGARTTRAAALDLNDDGLAARRALAVVVSALERRAGAAMGQSSSELNASDADGIPRGSRTTRFRRRDQRTHDEIVGARSRQRRARGSSRARRRCVGS